MALGILQNGIVHRREDGTVTIFRPGKNGGEGTDIEVPYELADTYRLATGEVVEGDTEPIVMTRMIAKRLRNRRCGRSNSMSLQKADTGLQREGRFSLRA